MFRDAFGPRLAGLQRAVPQFLHTVLTKLHHTACSPLLATTARRLNTSCCCASPHPAGFCWPCPQGSDNCDPRDAGQSQSCSLGCSGFGFLLPACCRVWRCPAPVAASEGRGQSVFSAPLPSQKLRLDVHSDAPGYSQRTV